MTDSNILKIIEEDLAKQYPLDIVKILLSTYSEIKINYYLNKFEPAELNGGKFCEAAIRLLEYETKNSYTPFGTPINMQSKLSEIGKCTNVNDSVRLHIPRVIIGIYNIRNRRGVGHVGGDVNPNNSDSLFILAASDWIMSEIIRLHYNSTLDEAQQIVDNLVQRRLLIVCDVQDKKRVLNHKLPYRDKALLILATIPKNGIDDRTLCDWVEHSNISVFRRDVLRPLHKNKFIEYNQPNCIILPPGLIYVEERIQTWIDDM